MASATVAETATDWHVNRIAAFRDNYIWLLENRATGDALVVDPGEADGVLAMLEARGLHLRTLLITHHHNDHIGGIPALVAATGAEVWGPAHPAIFTTRVVDDGVQLRFDSLRLDVMALPGHTLSHIAFHWPGRGVFVGDTLFGGGCGRLFEGSPAQMHASLQRLAALPAATAIWCAHEYTEANLRFAAAVEPDNPAVLARQQAVAALRAHGEASIPSQLADERASNPFLRTHIPEVRKAAEDWAGCALNGGAEVFAALRAWKDGFR